MHPSTNGTTPSAAADLGELQRLLTGWLARAYPAWHFACLEAHVGGPRPLMVPVVPLGTPRPGPACVRDQILAVIAEAGRPMKACIIARRCERELTGHFYRIIRNMIHTGVLEHDADERTYGLPGMFSTRAERQANRPAGPAPEPAPRRNRIDPGPRPGAGDRVDELAGRAAAGLPLFE